MNTIKRNEQGRFIDIMRLKDSFAQLGNSRDLTFKRFYNQGRKLLKNRKLYEEYKRFVQEYLQLGHMKAIQENNDNTLTYYLPHHPTVKESSNTMLVRVVFDASMKSDSELLNDIQHIGYTVKDELLSIILRFIKYKYVISSDISKMYGMIIINPNNNIYNEYFGDSIPRTRYNILNYVQLRKVRHQRHTLLLDVYTNWLLKMGKFIR